MQEELKQPIPAQGIDHAPVPFIAWEVARHDTGAVDDLNAAEIRETWRSDHAKLAEGADAAFEAWWAQTVAVNGGESVGMDCKHWARHAWQARGQQAGVPEGWADDLRAIENVWGLMGEPDNDEQANAIFAAGEALERLLAAAPGEAG